MSFACTHLNRYTWYVRDLSVGNFIYKYVKLICLQISIVLVSTQLNIFHYCYLTLIILIDIIHSFARKIVSVNLILLLCKETIVQFFCVVKVYLVGVSTFDNVDYIFGLTVLIPIYYRCCFRVFVSIGFYFYEGIIYSTYLIFAFWYAICCVFIKSILIF